MGMLSIHVSSPAKLRQDSCVFIKKNRASTEPGASQGLRGSEWPYDARNRWGMVIRLHTMSRRLAQLQKVAENDGSQCRVISVRPIAPRDFLELSEAPQHGTNPQYHFLTFVGMIQAPRHPEPREPVLL